MKLFDGKGTILLRQIATDRYAAVYREQESSSKAGQDEDEDPPKIAFLSAQPHDIGNDAEFQLIGPIGKDSFGVAIL